MFLFAVIVLLSVRFCSPVAHNLAQRDLRCLASASQNLEYEQPVQGPGVDNLRGRGSYFVELVCWREWRHKYSGDLREVMNDLAELSECCVERDIQDQDVSETANEWVG